MANWHGRNTDELLDLVKKSLVVVTIEFDLSSLRSEHHVQNC